MFADPRESRTHVTAVASENLRVSPRSKDIFLPNHVTIVTPKKSNQKFLELFLKIKFLEKFIDFRKRDEGRKGHQFVVPLVDSSVVATCMCPDQGWNP